MKSPYLSIILPIRMTESRTELLSQIDNISLDEMIPPEIEFIIVDDGSPSPYASQIQEKCHTLNLRYLRLMSQAEPFSLARTRNAGAAIAEGEFIMFQDLDILPYHGFYRDLLIEIEAQELAKSISSFLMIGVIYLTREGTESYQPDKKHYYIDKMLQHDEAYIQKHSSGTSHILLHKKHFETLGGYDEYFSKWGHEDIEFNARLILQDNLYSLPSNFLKDERNFSNIYQYEGWKSLYRLYGDRTLYKGIVLFHAWHSNDKESSYYDNKLKNKHYFHRKLEAHLQAYQKKQGYQLSSKSPLLDRYQYARSPENRLQCKSLLQTIYFTLKKKFRTSKK